MAATLATLLARKATLEEVISTGQLKVKFADREVQYRDMAEMQAALALLDKQIAIAEGRRQTRQIRVNSTKGFS